VLQVLLYVGLVCSAAFRRFVTDIGMWMVLVFYRCCLFKCFILFLFDNGDTKCFSSYKCFFGIFHFFYICKWKDGAFLTVCYAAIASTSGMYLYQILKVILLGVLYEVKKIALCECRVR
jgi:hypothetical protein